MFFVLTMPFGVHAQFNVDRLLTSGRVALHYEDYVLSIQYFNQAVSQKPYLWEPWQLRAIAKFYLDDWQGAENDATKAIELNPYITELYDLRGITRIRQQKYEDAIADYTKAISQKPNNQNYWHNRAVCLLESKEYDRLHANLDSLITKWKKSPQAYLMNCEAYLQEKDTTLAEEWLAKSLEVDPYNGVAWRVRAYIALNKSRWSDADEYFTKALHYKPKDLRCHINRATVRLKLNNLRGAMEDYDTALELDPENFLVHYNRGILRQKVGDDNRAIEDFDYVLRFEPNNIMAIFNRATLLDRTGDLKGAIRDYSKVIERFPNFWTGLYYRASCYRRLGMTAKAEQDEFRIFKAQMDKHIGIQNRWSKKKISEVRKMSDIDIEKYDQIVVDDKVEEPAPDYKSEYRGKVQNRKIAENFQPYQALTFSQQHPEMSYYTSYDNNVDSYAEHLKSVADSLGNALPHIGAIGEGYSFPTYRQVEHLTRVLKRIFNASDAADVLLARAVSYSTAQNYNEALTDINASLEEKPDSWMAIWQRAVCASVIAEYDKKSTPQELAMRHAGIVSDFDSVLKQQPNNASVLYSYGTFCAKTGKYDKALELLTKSIDSDKDLPQAYYNRGLVYLKMNETAKAKADFSKAGEMGLYSAYSLLKR